MKKIDFKLITIFVLVLVVFGLLLKAPKIQEVEKIVEVEKEVIVTDTIEVEVEVPYEVITEVRVPYEVKVLSPRDTIMIEKIVNVPVEVVKTVYVDKPYETIVEVPVNEAKWFLGFGYKFDKQNYFSGTDIKLLHKFKNDKMFSLDAGLRNDLLDIETRTSKLTPYIGASVYFRLDK